jgi:four helix bundle protein
LVQSYRDLVVWQKAMDLAESCYIETRQFPNSEMYGLTGQIRRASSSVAANIAEGNGRENTGSYIQFLRMAQGSLKERETHLLLSRRVDLLEDRPAESLLEQCETVGKMLRAMIRSLQDRQARAS